MIQVTLEMLPHGRSDRKYHLGTILITNDGTGSLSVGHYNAGLSKRGKPHALWKTARTKGFPRQRLGAYDLLYRILREAVGDRNTITHETETTQPSRSSRGTTSRRVRS